MVSKDRLDLPHPARVTFADGKSRWRMIGASARSNLRHRCWHGASLAQFLLGLAAIVPISCRDRLGPSPSQITISVPYELDSLDPQERDTISNFSILSNFYEPLVRTDAQLRIRPCLAASWETPDPSTWIFNLDRNARFHDGRQVEARDVVYTITRLLTTPHLEMLAYVTNISEVTELDRGHVRIRTERPVAVLLNRLNFVLIVPNGATTEDLARHENGSGPYRLIEWRRNDCIRMVRDDWYWGPGPPIRYVTFRLSRTPDQAIEDMAAGRSQLIQSNSKRLRSAVTSIGGHRMLIHGSLFVKYLAFDVSRDVTSWCSVRPNPFKSNLVRQAVNLGIDREALVASLPSYAIAASQPVPHFVFGFNPQIVTPKPDLEQARALMARAGLADGFEATMHVRQILQQTADIIVRQLAAIGIHLKLKILSDHDFFDALERRDATLFLSRFGCPTGDASYVLENALHSTQASSGVGASNWGGYSNPAVDSAIEESMGIATPEKRRLALERIMPILMEDLPWIPLYSNQEVYAIDDSLSWEPRNDSYIIASEISPRH